MTNDRLAGLAIVTALLFCLGVSLADNANASGYSHPKPHKAHRVYVGNVYKFN